MADAKARLQEIVNAYLDRDSGVVVDTGIVASHIAQMKLFGIRQGVEFFPSQDNFGSQRKDFLDRVCKYNKLDTRLDSIWEYFICDGQGLFYIRPTKNNYRLYYFRKHEYRSYYNVDGELDEVVIIYSYKVRKAMNGFGDIQMKSLTNTPGVNNAYSPGAKRYIRLSIKADSIEETHSESELNFDMPTYTLTGDTKKFPNTLNFIPCVEITNNPQGFSAEGHGDFDALANAICTHDELMRTMRKNITFFGNPTLLSSRPKTDLMESGGDMAIQRPSIAANSGFASQSPMSASMFKADPVSRGMEAQIRVPRVIANLEPNDRVGYIVPDAITGDQNAFGRQYREEIRTALGGVDELSISAGVTATEYKSLFGRVAATTKKKANAIYEHGICRCFELIIYQEEQLFKSTLAQAAKLEKPIPLEPGAPEEQQALYKEAMQMYEQKLKQIMMACIETQMIPPNVVGLIPDGDITVLWRWLGPVYEDSTQDILNNSIVVRNLQELGVDSIEALKYLFPSKTDEERAEMLSGFPFRMVNELQGAYAAFSKLVGGMMQTPHPQAPDLPMAADPRLDLTPYLYRTLEALQKEMSYAGRYRPIDPTDEPSSGSGGSKQLRGAELPSSTSSSSGTTGPVSGGYELPPSGTTGGPQLPIKPVSVRPPIPIGDDGQSMGIGVQQGGGPSEQPSSIPVPGSTVSTDDLQSSQLRTGQRPGYVSIGSADLASQPDILAQLFPNFFDSLRGNQRPVAESDGGGQPKSKQRKPVRSK